jgi:hypothetical protein
MDDEGEPAEVAIEADTEIDTVTDLAPVEAHTQEAGAEETSVIEERPGEEANAEEASSETHAQDAPEELTAEGTAPAAEASEDPVETSSSDSPEASVPPAAQSNGAEAAQLQPTGEPAQD